MDANNPKNPDYLPKVTQIYTDNIPSSHLEKLSQARKAGGGFLWIGLGAAFAWWIAAFGGTAALLGLDTLSTYSAAVIGAGAVALAIPGIMLLMAGLLARENARAASTNAVVLEAAARLLAPMETTGQQALTFADQMRQSASDVDRSMAHALSSMKAMSAEISDERQRLESVSYVAADNAKELSKRLHDERKALETLAADISKQTEMMSEAIPRQAAQMRDSARAAAADIAQADQALEVRLDTLDKASGKLSQKVDALDTMAVDASKRSEELIFAIARMEEKLEQSRKMVDQAVRAGELEAASAQTSGDRLTESVNAALERARMASRDIQGEALQAAERAAASLSQLKAAGKEAAEAVRAARAEADEQHARNFENKPFASSMPMPMPVPPTPRPGQPRVGTDIFADAPPPKISPTGWLKPKVPGPSQPKLEDDDVFEDSDPTPATIEAAPAAAQSSAARSSDDDLFDTRTEPEPPVTESVATPAASNPPGANDDAQPADSETDGTPKAEADKPAAPVQFFRRRDDRPPSYLKPVGGTQASNLAVAHEADEEDDADEETADAEATADAAPETEDAVAAPPVIHGNGERRKESHQWSDIIADMERDEAPQLPREEIAEEVIHRLMDSGIRLGEIFRPRDKKKIAAAARKGEGVRRKAISDAAARQVQRVQKRLDVDPQLMHMSREFLSMEEPDALMALDKTCRSSKNASARLSAFLLIDAALG